MEPVFQSIYFNPAAKPLNNVSVGLPVISSFGLDFRNTGFKIGDLIKDQIDVGSAIGAMRKTNFLSQNLTYDLFHFRIKVRKSDFGFYVQDNLSFLHSYPKQFYELLWYGNGNLNGQTLDFKKLSYDLNYYRTYGFHFSHEFKKLRIGANLKYLTGFANAYTKINKLNVGFTDRYEVTADADASFYTAGLIPNDSTRGDEYDQDAIMKSQGLNNSNKGWGIDIGASYKINKHWEVGGAITNIGTIKWKQNAYQHKLNGGGEFQGFDLANEFLAGKTTTDEQVLNGVKQDFSYNTQVGSYRTWLIPRFNAQIRYNLRSNTYFTNTVFFEKYKTARFVNSLAIYHQFGKVLGSSLSINYAYRSINNIGFGIYAKLGPCQIYMVGDNVAGVFLRSMFNGFIVDRGVLAPVKMYNLRLGMNLVFGSARTPNKQTYRFKKSKKEFEKQ
jgi:hypothetical protein